MVKLMTFPERQEGGLLLTTVVHTVLSTVWTSSYLELVLGNKTTSKKLSYGRWMASAEGQALT